jgi:hypothetical protein
VVFPFFLKISQQIAKVLKRFNFKIIFSPIHNISISKVKDPTDGLDNWGIYQIHRQ